MSVVKFTKFEKQFINCLKQNEGKWYLVKFVFRNIELHPEAITDNLLNYLKDNNCSEIHIPTLRSIYKDTEKFEFLKVFKGIRFIIDDFRARGNDKTAIKLEIDKEHGIVNIVETIKPHYEYNDGNDKTIIDVVQYSLDVDDECLTVIGENSFALLIHYNDPTSKKDEFYQNHTYFGNKVKFNSKLYSGNSEVFNKCIMKEEKPDEKEKSN